MCIIFSLFSLLFLLNHFFYPERRVLFLWIVGFIRITAQKQHKCYSHYWHFAMYLIFCAPTLWLPRIRTWLKSSKEKFSLRNRAKFMLHSHANQTYYLQFHRVTAIFKTIEHWLYRLCAFITLANCNFATFRLRKSKIKLQIKMSRSRYNFVIFNARGATIESNWANTGVNM